jgi:tape measure domain-containing protein
MSLNIGELYGTISLDDSKFDSGVQRAQGRLTGLGSSMARTAGHMTAALGRAALMGVTALGGMAIAGGVMGVKVAAGNEQAMIGFTTMLGSAKKAGAFLKDLQSFAAKTPFEFPELQTAASSLISAGVAAKDVIPIMTTLGDATSGMGTGSEGVQRATVALQQMNAAGKISGEDLNQLRDAGIPVYDLLATATGKSKAKIVELAAAGKLGKKELTQLMTALSSGKGLERFNGLMAKQSTSLVGLWSTLKDTLGQGLATAITPMIPMIKDGLGGAITFLTANMPKLASGLKSVVTHVQAWFTAQNSGKGFDLGAMFDRVQAAAKKMWPMIKSAAKEMQGIGPIISVTGTAFRFVADHIDTVVKYMPLLITAFVAYKAAQAASNLVALAHLPIAGATVVSNFALAGANRALATQMMLTNGVEKVGMVTRLRATIATVAGTAAGLAASAASKVWAAGQWLLNAALTANPIGLVIAGIALLIGGIVLIATKTTWFQTVWEYMSGALGKAWQWLWNSILAPIIRFVLNGFATITDGIASMLRVLSNIPGFGWAKTAADKMAGAADKARALASGVKDIKDKKVAVDVRFTSNYSLIQAQMLSLSNAKNKLAGMPGRAHGGPVRAGMPYVVGEHRPELFVPDQNGTIIPRVPSVPKIRGLAAEPAPAAMGGFGRAGQGGPLVGLAIEGTLDLGNGLVGMLRGVVKSELAETGARARYAGVS